TADGQKRSVYQTDQAVWFDIDDNGRVAIATLAAPRAGAATPTTEDLFIYEGGALRRLGTRAVGDSGIPISFADAVGWTLGTGSVRRIDGAEIVPLAGGATRTIRPESGCVYTGRTAAEIVTICPSGARLFDVASGAVRGGPQSRVRLQLHADHAYEGMPWASRLRDPGKRGLGAELRILGIDPDAAERRARERGHVVLVATKDWPHGWRDCVVEDPDGYTFAIGTAL